MATRLSPRPGIRESAAWCAIPSLGLDVITAQYVRQVFPLHFHDTYVVCVDEQGAHASWYRGANRIVPARALALVTPGEVHTGQRVPGQVWHYRAVYPGVNLMRRLAREAGVAATEVALSAGLSVEDPALAEAFLAAHRQSERAPESLAAASGMTEVLVALLRRHAEGRRTHPDPQPSAGAVHTIRDYLHAHLADPVRLVELAHATGLSQYAVLRAFRRATGLPPHRYLTQLRVVRAAEHLRAGLAPARVAVMVGFADQSHLHRHFRRLVGVTPGSFAGSRQSAPGRRPSRFVQDGGGPTA